MKEGLSFDDVLLVPKRSSVQSRKDVDTSTLLTKNISLNIPIVSANMDTVTESHMAVALARAGGIGIIHRFLTIEEQVREVGKVKRAENVVIEHPYTVLPSFTVRAARRFMHANTVSGLLVVDEGGKLVGIVTARDLLFEYDDAKEVGNVMSTDLVTASVGTSLSAAKEILHKNRVEKLPIIDSHGKPAGLITSKDIVNQTNFPKASKDAKGRLRVGAAVGIKDDFVERAGELVHAGVDVIVVDIAHGHSDGAIAAVRKLKSLFPDNELIAGNVATAEGVADLISAGADAVKVGVGPGSVCTTRIVTGSGVPQLTAIIDCAKSAGGVPVIADGGIKNSGDVAKSVAAGAFAVMIGGLLAGTDESPGFIVTRHGARYKIIRGMASLGANLNRKEKEKSERDINDYVPEGVEAMVPYRGCAMDVINQLVGGFRSGMSYCGSKTIKEMQKNAEFVKITSAGMKESKPHDVSVL
ncbi:MAG: IMP dehydrogenase [Candidatus Aenigmarchaeota archaeon]|nr:IMP dehydrogenase [Candidatus Aenigmarchaeota archaeon]